MKHLNEIEVELKKSFPALLPLNRQSCYLVPSGYFQKLTGQILEKIQREVDLNLPVTKTPFEVPDNYFQHLSDNVLNEIKFKKARVASEVELELQKVAPFLNEVTKENMYFVPEDYFEKENLIPTQNHKDGKVITFTKEARNWSRYLIAASVMFLIALGTYLSTTLQPAYVKSDFNIEKSLQTVNDQEIISYLKENSDITTDVKATDAHFDIQSLLKNVSDEEIRNYLDDDGGGGKKNIKGI